MAKQRQTNGNGRDSGLSAKSAQNSTWSTNFVDLPLSEADKAAFEEWRATQPPLINLIFEIVDSGCKISASWNEKTGSYIVAVTCTQASHPNANSCFTSFSSNLEKSLYTAAYKYDLYCAGREQWAVGQAKKDDWG